MDLSSFTLGLVIGLFLGFFFTLLVVRLALSRILVALKAGIQEAFQARQGQPPDAGFVPVKRHRTMHG